MEFCWLNHDPHIIIKEIAIWRVRWPSVRGDAVAEFFSQPRMGSPACVAWHKVFLFDVGSSSSHCLNPEKHYILQRLDGGLCVESEAIWEDE